MASSTKTELLCKPLQELLIAGDNLPEKYIYKDSDYGVIDSSPPLMEIPVIDLRLLASSSPSGEDEVEKLKSALCSWGCFQAINHGMESEFLEKLRGVGKEFFGLPMEEKHKYSRAVSEMDGYGNDMETKVNWDAILHCREILHEYTKKLQVIINLLLKSMARSLKLKEESFLKQYGERAIMQARFNFYPPCARPDCVLGLKPHSDGSAITILLQDREVDGLQILKDDEQWIRVPIIPHALLVNVGDQIEIMSNGIFKSPVHRAVTNSERERTTLAVFCSPEAEMEIGPMDELIDEKRPRLYKNVKNYVDSYFQYYQHWKRPIDAAKISF
ncbi:2-oxoglutarate (2OG) and Fe(II)-dependent oxygenase superfamily protein [Actinidia rufa]|uniref:2-oxoglutarate (2OG) and Fe(II)-dependent oxygenase superfamily protein n=1 Tax=Actinidia rufa TaxID=165716 RepID=A0A7J0FM28_9ERIC|nr:2-oxoglutarate (2OG) and Fe(II)-dependent oxygenase superfamily protein [Actinidia rufa]